MHRAILSSAIALALCGGGSARAEAPPAVEAETNPQPAETASAPPGELSAAPELVAPVDAPTVSLKPRIPLFNAICGGGIEVHADEGGPVFIDGGETHLTKFNDNYFEASRGGTTISISFRPDGSLSLSFSGPNRANGICTLK